jgi:NAD(P)-dependent dehydrogenase (short-subunit alcohol dehydrogenase family)
LGWRVLVALANGRARVTDGKLAAAVGGKTVLVTGASYGIGEATARRLGAAGAKVLLLARTADRLETVTKDIAATGGSAYDYPMDLTDTSAIEATIARILDEHGHVDVLVSNAGKSIRRSIAETYGRFHDIERTNAVNYLGPSKLILELLPSMRARRTGHIVNVSTAGVRTPPAARWSAYLASKSAFDVWLRCIAQEIRGDGVTVSTVYMGLVHTRMSEPTAILNRMPGLSPEQAAALVCQAITDRPHNLSPPYARPVGAFGHIFRASTDRLLARYYEYTERR